MDVTVTLIYRTNLEEGGLSHEVAIVFGHGTDLVHTCEYKDFFK